MVPTQKSGFAAWISRPRGQALVLSLLWLCVQGILFYKNGILTQLEAVKYLDEARFFIQTGAFESHNFLYYSLEILLIAACLKAHLSFIFIVLLQWAVNALSMVLFYKTARMLSSGTQTAFMATAALILMVYYQEFNSFLYTESLYFSLLIIFTYFLFLSPSKGIRGLIPVAALMIVIYFTRPTGIFLPYASVLFYLIRYRGSLHRGWLGIVALGSVLVFFVLVNLAIGSGGEFDFLLPYLKENIICGVSTVAVAHQFLVKGDPNSIAGILYVVTHHFPLFVKLGFLRLLAFFGVYRSYFSLLHNTVLLVFFFTPYALILMGVRSLLRKHRAEGVFLIFHVALMALTVMITCDEWANRFIMGEYPLLLLLAVISNSNLRGNAAAELTSKNNLLNHPPFGSQDYKGS